MLSVPVLLLICLVAVLSVKLYLWFTSLPTIFIVPRAEEGDTNSNSASDDDSRKTRDLTESITPNSTTRETDSDTNSTSAPTVPLKQTIKNPMSVDNQPAKQYETIVIGTGISGLASAQIMKRANAKKFDAGATSGDNSRGNVLLLEQHDTFGGCLHTFEDQGFEYDTGFHYAGALGGTHINQFMLESLGMKPDRFVRNGEVFDRVVIGCAEQQKSDASQNARCRVYDMKRGWKQWRDQMLEYFPQEQKAIDEFLRLTKVVADSCPQYVVYKMLPSWLARLASPFMARSYFKYSQISARDVVHSLTENKELRHVLLYCYGDVSTSPQQTPFTVLASVFKHFVSHGSFYPKGGSQALVSDLLGAFMDENNHAFSSAPVEEILLSKRGSACGVRLSSGEKILAKNVISSAGLKNTFQKLVPPTSKHYQALNSMASKYKSGAAHLSVYLGFNKSQEEMCFPKYNIWLASNNKTQASVESYTCLEDALNSEIPLQFFSFPSAKDPEYGARHGNKSVALLLFPVRYEWFSQWREQRVKQREGEYQYLKQQLADRAIEKMQQMFPQTKGAIDFVSVGTPLTSQHYLSSDKGTSYGLDPSCARERDVIRAKTPIPNLYITGQDLFQSCGFGSALVSSIITASAVCGRILFIDLENGHKQWKKQKEMKKLAE